MVRAVSASLGILLVAGVFATPALAGGPSEVGYRQGALGVSAISAADYRTAEAQLNRMDGVAAGDPLRLINLGNVYAGTGRMFDAEKAYVAALNAESVDVLTADGAETNTHAVARKALGRVRAVVAAR
ncbi:hypothetical protein [Sphingobium phenoxybenzoativorans]|uniref:hypothetical protein n=1 Tax=Sphingobium phenoxybenzoativorans TaxID=1592790 RepID=UPI000872A6B1|nr:hypothetical protein [Sphingobium phenoxybenzoativorans]